MLPVFFLNQHSGHQASLGTLVFWLAHGFQVGVYVPTPSLYSCVDTNEFLNSAEPPFLHLCNGIISSPMLDVRIK